MSKNVIYIALSALVLLPTNVLSVIHPVPTGSLTPLARRAAPPATVPALSSPSAFSAIQHVSLAKVRETIVLVAKQLRLGLPFSTSTHHSITIPAFLCAPLFLRLRLLQMLLLERVTLATLAARPA